MVYNRKEVVERALAVNGAANTPGMCQAWTRGIIGVDAVGDVDGDNDADAIDGWLSEPEKYRHYDRNPPGGVPVAFSGGRNGFGHRAVSIGNGRIASTDAGGTGRIAIVSIAWIETYWGMQYLGWSETMGGELIPTVEKRKRSRLDAISWNVNQKNDPTNVRANLIKMIDRHSPDAIYLYEATHLYNRLDGLGYQVLHMPNGSVMGLVRNNLTVTKSRLTRMREYWTGPLMGKRQAPRTYRTIKIKKRKTIWKTIGVHLPFGNKPRSESVRWIRKAIEATQAKRPVIAFGDFNFNEANVTANIANKVGAKVAGSKIDLAVYKNCELVKETVLDTYGSDHNARYYRFER